MGLSLTFTAIPMLNLDTLTLAMTLLAYPSITPLDAGCQDFIGKQLQSLGFKVEHIPYGKVSNLWARHGQGNPVLVFAGHTDVVPTGPLEQWSSPPFEPTVKDGYLYGRGAADMKGSLAAMLTATSQFLAQHPQHRGSIAFLITSDEEGPGIDGTQRVIELLKKRGEKLNWCIVGEPSSEVQIGDVIKHGRRGSLSGHLKVLGKQGHIAYPQLADNPILASLPGLQALHSEVWDQGNQDFPATSWQVSNIQAGTGAGNVIPGELNVQFNFRYSTAVTAEQLIARLENILNKYHLHYHIDWNHSGLPFLTPPGDFLDTCSKVIKDLTGKPPTLSTAGGTSDGRFIAPTGCQVIEIGPVNDSIHQINERVKINDLNILSNIYLQIMVKLLHG